MTTRTARRYRRTAAALGDGWAQSTDRSWTTAGDQDGFHLLTADASEGYRWRTAATLSEPGVETDQWIGNVCVTGSGDRAVVVYAPRAFRSGWPRTATAVWSIWSARATARRSGGSPPARAAGRRPRWRPAR
jgi:hypothetical protein